MAIRIKDVKQVKILMIKKGYTQRGLAKKSEVSDTTICHLLSNKCGCGPDVSAKLCRALEVEFDDIFYIDDADMSQQEPDDQAATLDTGTEG